MDIELMLKQNGLFAVPLNNGDWAVGRASHIYSVKISDDHYKDPELTIGQSLPAAIEKWVEREGGKVVSIAIPKLTKSDKGRWVEYVGFAGERDKGRIKSWNQSFIFVVYKCGGDWDNYENYTAQATDPTQLVFLPESEVEHADNGS